MRTMYFLDDHLAPYNMLSFRKKTNNKPIPITYGYGEAEGRTAGHINRTLPPVMAGGPISLNNFWSLHCTMFGFLWLAIASRAIAANNFYKVSY